MATAFSSNTVTPSVTFSSWSQDVHKGNNSIGQHRSVLPRFSPLSWHGFFRRFSDGTQTTLPEFYLPHTYDTPSVVAVEFVSYWLLTSSTTQLTSKTALPFCVASDVREVKCSGALAHVVSWISLRSWFCM